MKRPGSGDGWPGALRRSRGGQPFAREHRSRVRTPAPFALGSLALFALGGCGLGPAVDRDADFVLFNVRVWDGTGAELSELSILQLSEGRVFSIAPMPEQGDVAAMAAAVGVEALDGERGYVIPGLINAHGHVGGTWTPGGEHDYRTFVQMELARYARFGVTTVVSLGGEREPAFAVRGASWTDSAPPIARLQVAGPVVTAASPEEAAITIDRLAQMRPDWVKIRVDDNLGTTTKMTPETYASVIARAHSHGLQVASHLFYHDDAKGLLGAGTDLVAHSIRDQPVDQETIDLFHETGTCYVPTLTREVSTYVYGERPAFFDDPFLTVDVDSAQVAVLSDGARQAQVAASGAAEAYGRALSMGQANLSVLREAGVPIAFGTDSGPLGRFQGYFEHMEMELMADAGLTPDMVLRSATGVAADCLDLDDVGTLEPGKRADFVVLRSNPLVSLDNMREIDGVWVGGQRVEGVGARR